MIGILSNFSPFQNADSSQIISHDFGNGNSKFEDPK